MKIKYEAVEVRDQMNRLLEKVISSLNESNPNLNDVLKTDIELFKHAFLVKDKIRDGQIVIGLEPYDRDLTIEDSRKLQRLVREYEDELKKMFNVDYVEIQNYLF